MCPLASNAAHPAWPGFLFRSMPCTQVHLLLGVSMAAMRAEAAAYTKRADDIFVKLKLGSYGLTT